MLFLYIVNLSHCMLMWIKVKSSVALSRTGLQMSLHSGSPQRRMFSESKPANLYQDAVLHLPRPLFSFKEE